MVSRSRSEQGRVRRGFAAMDPEERREISRRGGTASHESGRGHEFNSQEARAAGRLGGEARWGRSRSRSRAGASSRIEQEEEQRRATPAESELEGYRPSRTRETEEERGVEYDPEQRRSEGSSSESRWGRQEEEEDRGGESRGRRGSGSLRAEEPRSGRSRGGRSRTD